ncbi:MAG: hypothetical protein EOO52_13570 [Gammaproteobacteria bacterium]|nr:MAG: hypothetical protein EOO52_13570 [Gammaproteobacteria bacterium]
MAKTTSKCKTIEQASKRAISLGIKTSTEYRLRCFEDPLLPYSPETAYKSEWRGWPHFLKTKRKRQLDVPDCFYASYSQARQAARRLDITSEESYSLNHKKDSKLPANPQDIYGAYWRDWDRFLTLAKSSDRSREIYTSLAKAKAAAQALGAQTVRDYTKLYRQDLRLPSNPSKYYSNWKSWYDFLGTKPLEELYYKKLSQASAAAIALNISTARDYIKRYSLDGKLPSNPSQYYENWESWDSFLRKR